MSDYLLVGLSTCRTIDLSDYRHVGLSTCRTIDLSDYRPVGLSTCRTIDLDPSTHSHNNKNNPPLLPFVIPYHREHRHIKKILDRNWYLLENDSQLQLIFSTKHFLSYKRNPNIHDHLVHTSFTLRGGKTQKETSTKLFVTPLGTDSGMVSYRIEVYPVSTEKPTTYFSTSHRIKVHSDFKRTNSLSITALNITMGGIIY